MLLNAKTPVYAYVPPGVKAASAGALIAMAADKIYMVPTAQIGASEPRHRTSRWLTTPRPT
ncbi:MAG: hypothetical protein LM577_00005 [Thermoproteaceae archaeon]|jgi:membrane-bound serine protease (ClpP class)|nr:hypothetical protein [Thermoproteaceae archaeon]